MAAALFNTYALVDGPPSPGGTKWRSRVLVAGNANTGYGLGLDHVARILYRVDEEAGK